MSGWRAEPETSPSDGWASGRGAGLRPRLGSGAAKVAFAFAALAAAGAVAGLIWAAVAPRVQAVIQDSGVSAVHPETKAFAGADAWFVFITLAFGLAAGILGWVVARRRGAVVPLIQAGGGVLAAWIASVVGHAVSEAGVAGWVASAVSGSHHLWYLELRSTAAWLVWPFVAVFVHLLLTVVTPSAAGSPPDAASAPAVGGSPPDAA